MTERPERKRKADHKASDIIEPAQIERDADFRSVYANNAQITVSVFDLRMTFGESFHESPSSPVKQSVSVVMSLQHAKVFAKLLTSNIERYEAEVAEIVLPSAKPLTE